MKGSEQCVNVGFIEFFNIYSNTAGSMFADFPAGPVAPVTSTVMSYASIIARTKLSSTIILSPL